MKPIDNDFKRRFQVDGVAVEAQISPCSWMYPNHVLQLTLTLVDTRGQHLMRSSKPYGECSAQDVDDLIRGFKTMAAGEGLLPCPRCGKKTFNRSVFPSAHRDARCEACFLATFRADLERDAAGARALKRQRDSEMFQQGYGFCVDAWVHPEDGDDLPLVIYMKTDPTPEVVEEQLKRAGCVLCSDYQVRPLHAG